MSVSATGGAGGGAAAMKFEQDYSVAVAKKVVDARKVSGENTLALIQSASAPPVKPGHQLSVMA